MFQFPRFAPQAYGFSLRCLPCGRRVSPFGHPRITAFLPAPRGFSQAHAPFVASCRLGIHRVRLFAWPYNPNRPGRGARAVFDFASRLHSLFFARARPHARQVSPPGILPRPRALPKLLKMPRGPLVPPAGPRRPASAPRALAARRVCRLLLPPDHSGRRNHCGRRPALSAPAPSASPPSRAPGRLRGGGAREDRTPDLLRARQALSQLSYGPAGSVVGLGGIEPPTSPLSGVRSNQLSYRPGRLSLGQTIRCGRSRRGGPGRRKRR